MVNFLKGNNYMDTSCQKAGLQGFPGCIKHSCTARLLKWLDELTLWARMNIQAFKVPEPEGERILLLAEQPIQSLRRQYTSELSDRWGGQCRINWSKTDNSQLPGKLEVWCYQWLMWPLQVSQFPSLVVSKMYGISNTYIRRWTFSAASQTQVSLARTCCNCHWSRQLQNYKNTVGRRRPDFQSN